MYAAFYASVLITHNVEAVSHGSAQAKWLEYQDYRGIIHCHSDLSHDSKGSFAGLRKAAERRDVDFIVTTDHWSKTLYGQSRRGMYGGTLFIAGAELRKADGVTILAVPLPANFTPQSDWQTNAETLHKSGSLALAAHTEFSERNQIAKLDGAEIWNVHAESIEGSVPHVTSSYLHLAWPINLDLAFLVRNVDGAKRWHDAETAKEKIVPAFAGDDNHENYPFIGYERTFLLSSTHVWAKNLTEPAILDAIKNGRGYVAFEVFGRAEGFRAYVSSSDGSIALPGSTVSFGKSQFLNVAAIACYSCTIQILRNGKQYVEEKSDTARIAISEPGIYSAVVYRNGHPWIFSNSIAVQ